VTVIEAAELRTLYIDAQALPEAWQGCRMLVVTPLLRELVGASVIGAEGVDELEQIADLLDRQGYGADRIVLDPGVVRGLGYYTGPVYEAELTFEILDEMLDYDKSGEDIAESYSKFSKWEIIDEPIVCSNLDGEDMSSTDDF
jgi:hypothetical protein